MTESDRILHEAERSFEWAKSLTEPESRFLARAITSRSPIVRFDGPRYHPDITPNFSTWWRFKWRWLACAISLHYWALGPYDCNGRVDTVVPNGKRLRATEFGFQPEYCGFGWPFCRARRWVRRDRWRPSKFGRFSYWWRVGRKR